ncbi:OmpA family protein [Pelagibius sp.]|uniref:OmpA family protein n=1 Tax=Pelagibius sp. TaxID=1931238 RepID=UPI002639F051|nr:OmpA family protein [Pelagibius sp.]
MSADRGCFTRHEIRGAGSLKAIAAGLLAASGALTLALAGDPAEAQTRSNSGIHINTEVLDSLGPGPEPIAPLPPSPPPLNAPVPIGPAVQFPGLEPSTPNAQPGQPPRQGDGILVTRPGTLLFPPLQAPSSSLTPGFSVEANDQQRKKAFENAFANGPEPESQLLLPLAKGNQPPAADDGKWEFQTVIIDSRPLPMPAPRKPQPTPAMLAALEAPAAQMAAAEPAEQEPGLQESLAEQRPSLAPIPVETAELSPPPGLAPEFAGKTADTPAPSPSVASEAAPEPATVVAESSLETMASEPAEAPADPSLAEVADVALLSERPDDSLRADAPPTSSLPSPSPAVSEDSAPVSLLPEERAAATDVPVAETPASPATLQQTAALLDPVAMEDISFTFDADSAELTPSARAALRTLADDLRGSDEDRIQVLGFASSEEGSPDLARQLALSRALKVRTFLIDAGIPSARIQVRPPSALSGSGPANRVDIKPIGS